MDKANSYFINNPIFLKYKKRFNFPQLKSEEYLKSAFINERIIEIPYAVQALSSLARGDMVLDLGCTESILPLQLAGLGYKVKGYDFRPYPYTHPNLEFVQGDILKLPFPNEHFDAVVAISTIEHLGIGFYDDPQLVKEADQRGTDEVLRVLKKGGIFMLSVPFGIKEINQHQRVYDEKSLLKLLSSFEIIEKRYFINTEQGYTPNAWVEAEMQEASRISSKDKTNGICLIKAVK